MDEEVQGSQIQGEQTPMESAPIEQAPEVENQPSEKTLIPEETPTEKLVPVHVVQDERERRKSAETYIKQLEAQLGGQYSPPPPPYAQPTDQEDYVDVPQNEILTKTDYEFMRKEEKSWDKAEADFKAEFEEYPTLRKLAEGLRKTEALEGYRYFTPYDAVKEIVSDIHRAQAKGMSAAQQSEVIQKQVQLQGKGTNGDAEAQHISELRAQIGSRDGKVSNRALIELIKLGKA